MKKLLSLILALSLIISVAPMSFATGAEKTDDEPGMHFRFNAEAFGKTADISKEDIQEIDKKNEYASIETDPWYMDGQYAVGDYRITSKENLDIDNYPNSKPGALYWKHTNYAFLSPATSNGNETGNAGSALVLRVELNETGVFTPSITYGAGPTASNYLFLLAPVSAYTGDYPYTGSTVCNQGVLKGYYKNPDPALIKVGEQNLYAQEESKQPVSVSFDPVTIEAGEYYLFLVTNGRINNLPAGIKNSIYEVNLYSIDFTPEPEMTAEAAFTATEDTENPPVNSASIAAYTVCGIEDPVSLDAPSVNYGETCELEAPMTKEGTDGKTYNFLYWARGLESASNRKIVSTKNKFNYRPHEGVNYLIAVYEDADASKVEFYNGNGELMTEVALDEGNLPAVPYMAGYGESTGWKRQGDEKVYAAGEPAPTDGSMVFVAQYDDPAEDITITVKGGTGSDNYAYGDTVECKIDEAKKDSFSYWEKTINGKSQIVSLDETYTFNAWETCTVTAVYNGAFDLGRAARKVLLGTFTVDNQTAVMAEFIGFGDAKEKGIMFGKKRIAMTTDYAQFTITNDTDDDVDVTGYAIVDGIKYIDGEVTVAAAE